MPDPPGTQWLRGQTQQIQSGKEPLYMVGTPAGLRKPGNLDLLSRPQVKNPDGSTSTVFSMSVSGPEGSYLIPRVVGDRILSEDEAKQHFRQTGENLGLFDTDENADAYSQALHNQQDQYYREHPQTADKSWSQAWRDMPGPNSWSEWLDHLTRTNPPPTLKDLAYPYTAPVSAAYGAAQRGLGALPQNQPRTVMQGVMPGWQALPFMFRGQ